MTADTRSIVTISRKALPVGAFGAAGDIIAQNIILEQIGYADVIQRDV